MLPMPQIILSAVSVSPTLIWCIISIAVFLLLYMACGYVKAPPNKAYIVSGLRKKKKILIGRAGFRMPLIERIDKLSLDVMQVDVKTSEAVPTNEFINVTVDGVANIKISSNPELLEKAAEALLGMDKKQLIFLVTQVLEGNMREIVGSVGLKEMVQERQVVAEKIKENAVPDMQKLGIEIVNFNIQNFKDGAGTIENMGIDNVEQIRKNAQIAKANAQRDIAIATANAQEEANAVRVLADKKIAEQNADLSVQQAEMQIRADTKKAEADAAYSIQQENQRKTIEVTRVSADIARREKDAELAEKDILLKEKQLDAEIRKQADAMKYQAEKAAEAELVKRQREAEAKKYEAEAELVKRQREADADKYLAIQQAEARKAEAEATRFAMEQEAAAIKAKGDAEAYAIRVRGEAEAAAIKAKGEAEAAAMDKKAEAMKKYGQAAMAQMAIEVLPQVAKEVAAPLSKVDKITLYGEGGMGSLSGNVPSVMAKVFDTVKSATGIDLQEIAKGETYDAKVNKNISIDGKMPEIPVEISKEE